MKDLVIFGAGGLGREAAFLVHRINQVNPTWNLLGFIDDTPELQGEIINGIPVLGGKSYFDHYQEAIYIICALGDPKSKQIVVDTLCNYPNLSWATLIDPQAVISDYVHVGEGTLIFPNTTITVNVTIGNHVLIYYHVSVAHDVEIENFVSINHGVNISGNVAIGQCSRMGVGSKIIEKKRIGEFAFIGAGSVVISDVSNGKTVVGVPARAIEKKEQHCP